MTKELIWFEKLISSNLKELAQADISPEFMEHYSDRIFLELKNSKKEIFNDIAIKKYPKPKAQNKIWEYQKTITRLMDVLYAQNPCYWEKQDDLEHETLQLKIYGGLSELRKFLLEYFQECYNDSEHQSAIDYTLLKRDISSSIVDLRNRFMPYQHESLFNCMVSPLTGYINKNQKRITVKCADYIHCYNNHLLKVSVGVNKTLFVDSCERSIFRYNVNSPRVFRHFTALFQNKLDSKGTIKDKISLLNSEHRKVNRFYSKPNMAYRMDLPNLKTHLCEWIHEEIKHLEAELEMNSKIGASTAKEALPSKTAKLQTNFSVPEISLLLRLFHETGGVKPHTISAITKWASNCLESKKAQSISSDSLRAKYYDPSSTARQQMQKYLQEMLDSIKEIN